MFELIPLSRAKKDVQYRVIDMKGGRSANQRLSDLGLYKGALITVEGSIFGPILVRVLDSKVAIGRGLAQKVYVEAIA